MWKLIRIDFLDKEKLFDEGFEVVQFIEKEFALENLYFAHYCNAKASYLQIVTETQKEILNLEKFVSKQFGCVKDVSLSDNDGGSINHCYGYKICKEIMDKNKNEVIDDLFDLYHWMHNMLGFSYDEEIEIYRRWFIIWYIKRNYENGVKFNEAFLDIINRIIKETEEKMKNIIDDSLEGYIPVKKRV